MKLIKGVTYLTQGGLTAYCMYVRAEFIQDGSRIPLALMGQDGLCTHYTTAERSVRAICEVTSKDGVRYIARYVTENYTPIHRPDLTIVAQLGKADERTPPGALVASGWGHYLDRGAVWRRFYTVNKRFGRYRYVDLDAAMADSERIASTRSFIYVQVPDGIAVMHLEEGNILRRATIDGDVMSSVGETVWRRYYPSTGVYGYYEYSTLPEAVRGGADALHKQYILVQVPSRIGHRQLKDSDVLCKASPNGTHLVPPRMYAAPRATPPHSYKSIAWGKFLDQFRKAGRETERRQAAELGAYVWRQYDPPLENS